MKTRLSAALLLLLVLGCGEGFSSRSSEQALLKEAKMAPATRSAERAPQSPPPPGAPAVPRKIIYNAHIELLVGSFSEAESKLDELVKQFGGFVAESQSNSNPGAPRSGNWRVRIPVGRFTDFIGQVGRLGEAIHNRVDSDDVTDKYFDFQVRMENKKVQVERLQKIIKEQAGKITELLEAERELGRVTTELEQLKGTLKLWDNQTALATVDITANERTRYVPAEMPSFVTNISRTFEHSVDALTTFVQTVVLIAVALTPWLPVIALVAIPSWLLVRRALQRPAASKVD